MTPPAPESALIVGAGLMGEWHAHTLRRLAIPIAAIVDTDLSRASRLAQRFSGGRAFVSVQDALDATSPSVGHVCSPLSSHAALIEQALEAGLHVLCEKPIAASASETRRLVERAEQSKLSLCPVHQFLFQRGFRESVSGAASSGQLLHMDYVAVSAGADVAGAGGPESVMRDILPHPLSLIRQVTGAGFNSIDWSVTGGTPGEFRATSEWQGATIGILISMRGRPTRNTMRLVCEGGTFHSDLFHGFGMREDPRVSRVRKITRPFLVSGGSAYSAATNLVQRAWRREPAYPGLRELIARFYQHVRGVGPRPIAAAEVIDVATTRDRLLALRTI